MIRRFFRPLAGLAILFCVAAVGAGAQETATQYFTRVSERYASITDYTASLAIVRGDEKMAADVSYKSPNMLRLDFTDPEGQVMVTDGKLLQMWVPGYSVTFSQTLSQNGQASGASLATSEGLGLMQKYFTVAYDPNPDPVPLDQGSPEMVVKLKLHWKSSTEGFRDLYLAIDSDLRIRRVTGITTGSETIVFDFTNMQINQGIPASRFQYDSPPEGNTIENFLFGNPEG